MGGERLSIWSNALLVFFTLLRLFPTLSLPARENLHCLQETQAYDMKLVHTTTAVDTLTAGSTSTADSQTGVSRLKS